LQVAQEAFKFVFDLQMRASKIEDEDSNKQSADEKNKIIWECKKWWGDNCLYLQSDVRKQFYSCIYLAAGFQEYVRDSREKNDVSIINEKWEEFNSLRNLIENSVQLSPIKYKD